MNLDYMEDTVGDAQQERFCIQYFTSDGGLKMCKLATELVNLCSEGRMNTQHCPLHLFRSLMNKLQVTALNADMLIATALAAPGRDRGVQFVCYDVCSR